MNNETLNSLDDYISSLGVEAGVLAFCNECRRIRDKYPETSIHYRKINEQLAGLRARYPGITDDPA